MDDYIKKLEKRIKDLEKELKEREKDLKKFHAELFETNLTLEKLINKISSELKIANLIQKALVPTEFPNIPGFEFSTKFIHGIGSGGDYFDIFDHEDKFKYGIIISSSTGYNTSALFLSVLLKLTSQIEAGKGINASNIVENIAKDIVPNIDNNEKANILYAIVDRRSYEFSYCLVGNLICLLLSYDTHHLFQMEPCMPALEKDVSFNLEDKKIVLNPRDRIILCSRGVVDVINEKGEKYGEERLYQTILNSPRTGAHDLRNEILYEVEKFHEGKTEQKLDITVLIIEVKDRIIKLAQIRN